MDFGCFLCEKLFENHNLTIRHLKSEHNIIENKERIYCIKNWTPKLCDKYFVTFSGLRNHIKTCRNIKNEQQPPEVYNFYKLYFR